jgi:hypothetical protein
MHSVSATQLRPRYKSVRQTTARFERSNEQTSVEQCSDQLHLQVIELAQFISSLSRLSHLV